MELEVGMYVRTIGGIERLKKENDNGWFFEKSMIIKPDNIEKYIIKASFNIIDIIEEGDYVNGQRVNYINKDSHYFTFKFGSADYTLKSNFNSDIKYLAKKDIKSILTKEQYEAMAYRLGE